MLAIIAPLHEEIKELLTYIEVDTTVYVRPCRIWHGRIGQQEVCLVRSGPGLKAMAKAAEYCFKTFRPQSALLIGFGGATSPRLHQGDLVLSSTIVDSDSKEQWQPGAADLQRTITACRAADIHNHEGTIVTTESVTNSPHEKAFLGTQHGADVVETEGTSFVRAAESAMVPWMIARVVYDQMDMSLPEGLEPFHADGTISIGKVIAHMVRHPQTITRLSSLHFASSKGREILTTFTRSWLSQVS